MPSNLRRAVLFLGAGSLLATGIWGCGNSKELGPDELASLSTLTVHYATPGRTADPCDDSLPVIDGVAADNEWNSAQPLFINMTGRNGTGGPDVRLELRAIWSDEGSRLGQGADRIYFLARYADDDANSSADVLAFATPGVGEMEPSPIPVRPGLTVCDTSVIRARNWTRVNQGGREDQVLMVIAEADNPANMVDANRQLLANLGPEAVPNTQFPGLSNMDVWMYRTTRTSRHPVPQFARWDRYVPGTANPVLNEVDVPELTFSRFEFVCGFMEDLYIGSDGRLQKDGLSEFSPDRQPILKNFANRDPVPDRITQPLPGGRDVEGVVLNGGVSKELALWWPTSKGFGACDSIATSRIGRAWKWNERVGPVNISAGFPAGSYDYIFGWAIQTPTGSARDVRALAIHGTDQTKLFAVWTLEVMRDLNTGNPDDLTIDAGKTYRMGIGVFDDSGRIASGSTEILLKFEPSRTVTNFPRNRCS